eukprot:9526-Heterococcus_DN1.PRE.2
MHTGTHKITPLHGTGASSLVEAVYGLTFGSLYLFSGGNLFVPIACHFLYDFATFLEVHVRSTSRFGAAAAGASTPAARSNGINGSASTELDRKHIEHATCSASCVTAASRAHHTLRWRVTLLYTRYQVKAIIAQYRLNTPFVKNALAVFKRLDTDRNQGIDREELRLGSMIVSESPSSLCIRTFGKFTSDQEISAIFDRADTNKDGKIEFDEFLKLLSLNALQVQAVAGKAQR